jgi:hypothetical protein
MRKAFVLVAQQEGFRVLYELEKTGICKHSFLSVWFPQKPRTTGQKFAQICTTTTRLQAGRLT